MGFFSSLFGQAKELTKLGNSVANVKNMLDQFESDPDNTFLSCSAWICKVGIIDLIEKYGWAPNYVVYVPINGHQTKMYMTEVLTSIHPLYPIPGICHEYKLWQGFYGLRYGWLLYCIGFLRLHKLHHCCISLFRQLDIAIKSLCIFIAVSCDNSSLKYEITAKWLYAASQRVL